jgi:flagellar protein FlbD
MIEVTKMNGENIIVNADHIESVESNPDTSLVLTNGKRIVVRDRVPDVVRKVIEYQRSIRMGNGPRIGPGPGDRNG